MRSRDEEFREFARARAAPLHRTAYLLCGDWHLADDLVQESLAKCFRHWERVRQADNPDAYARRILVNEVHRNWRRRRNAPSASAFTDLDPAIPDTTGRVTDRVALLQALLTLPPRQRATVVLRYLEGMSERETADVLDCSVGTVKSQTSRALRTLETCFQREEITR
jgi:RNA polymerase sigma-70 factor (sigma-E family)